ncbi:MAG: MFS transporter [Planctomycetes bacterium]|nr:MFS transporter [Planctomycetota bacterium]
MKTHLVKNPSKSVLRNLSERHHKLVHVANYAWGFHFWFAFFNGIAMGMNQHNQYILKIILGGSLTHIAISTSFMTGGLILGVFTGTYLEGRNKRKFLIFGAIGYAGLGIVLLKSSPTYFLIGYGVQCFSVGAVMPTLSSFYQNAYLHTKIRNAYFGYAERYARIISMLTAFVAGYVMLHNASSYRNMIVIWIFSGMAAYLILAASEISNRVNEQYIQKHTKLTFYSIFGKPFVRTFKLFREDRDFWAFQWRFFIYGMAFLSIFPIMINYIVEEYDFHFDDVGILFGLVNGLIFIVFLPMISRVNSRLNPFISGSIACTILAAFTLSFFFAPSGVKSFVYIAIGIWSFGMIFIHLLWNLTSIYFADSKKKDASAYAGAHLLMVGIRGLTFPVLGAQMITLPGITSRLMFLISAILFILASLLFVQYHQKQKKRHSNAA